MISSAHELTLVDNTANGNQPGGPTEGSAGIAVLSEGGLIATGNVIKHNTAFGNLPVDIFWDQQGDNTFTGNRCKTSDPDELCAKGEHGHGHHGDIGDDDHGEHGHHQGGEADNGHHGDNGHHRAKHKHKHKKHKKHHKGKRHGD